MQFFDEDSGTKSLILKIFGECDIILGYFTIIVMVSIFPLGEKNFHFFGVLEIELNINYAPPFTNIYLLLFPHLNFCSHSKLIL